MDIVSNCFLNMYSIPFVQDNSQSSSEKLYVPDSNHRENSHHMKSREYVSSECSVINRISISQSFPKTGKYYRSGGGDEDRVERA